MRAVDEGRLEWVSSDIVVFEVTKTPDEARRGILLTVLSRAGVRVPLSGDTGRRARELREQGLRDLDALHLASAEAAEVGVLTTTDEQFLRSSARLRPPSTVQVKNPVVYVMEAME